MIDELPLDVFGETRTEPPPATEVEPTGTEVESPARGDSIPPAMRRVYDGAGIIGLALVLGIALRMVALGGLLPFANSIIAVLVYIRMPSRFLDAYFARMESWRGRLEKQRAALAAHPAPVLTRQMRWLYDGLAVAVIAAGSGIVLLLIGFGGWLPAPWLFLVALGAVVYFWLGRRYRGEYFALAEGYRQRVTRTTRGTDLP